MGESERVNEPMTDIEKNNTHKKIKRRKFFFSLIRATIYWTLCVSVMMLLDGYGYVTKHLAWFLGSAMTVLYASVEFKKR